MDKNCKYLVIPEGTTRIENGEFMNYKDVEEVIIPDSVVFIGDSAFMGCSKLKKVNLPKNLKLIGSDVFANCTALEGITIPESLTYLSRGMFSYCRNLKQVNIHDKIEYIDDFALYNCRRLKDFLLPKNVKSIGVMALCGCNKIEKLFIPKSLDNIENAAFSLMTSLREITVDPRNPKYMSDEGIALIDKNDGVLLQYAINSKNEEFVVGYYLNIIDDETMYHSLVYNLSNYSFAGAKYLRRIYISSEIESIGPKTFLNCNKLKEANIFHTPYGKTLLFNVHKSILEEAHIPFNKITIDEGITTLTDDMSDIFMNTIEVSLPSSLQHIGSNVFKKSRKLKELRIPENIRMIMPNTFYPETTINFFDSMKMKAKKFNMLETKTSEDFYKRYFDKDNIRIFSLANGTYYVSIDGYDVVKVSKDEIREVSSTSHLLEDKPDIFVDYLYNLLSINADCSSLLQSILFNKKLSGIFERFITDIDFVQEIAEGKHYRAIREMLDANDVKDETLFNGVLMQNVKKNDLELIIKNMSPSLDRFFRFSKAFTVRENTEDEEYDDNEITKLFNNIPKLVRYCNLLEQYQRYDRFLYNAKFFLDTDYENQEYLVKCYNSNIKRLIKASLVNETGDYQGNNLNDLFKLSLALGVFSDNDRLCQRVCNFLTEKLFCEVLPDGTNNENRIVGDDIHRVFCDMHPREELDEEFILFFIENYKELISIEKAASGFISRVYNSFRNISECSMADSGEQRHLNVTIDKCKNYFLMELNDLDFDDDDKDLVELLGKYFTPTNSLLKKAKLILHESLKAPRNIFTKTYHDEEGNIYYDNDSNNDLKGSANIELSYEWLPKQSVENMILGKYCNCCAHLNGAGAGIMRASMILDCCQNLVIRNGFGKIIAKATLFVNKEAGYAVFNTMEMNMLARNIIPVEKIYQTFIEGTKAFIEKYNNNYPDKPITYVTIGRKRNVIEDYLLEENHEEVSPCIPINYSAYGYEIDGKLVGGYEGDSSDNQILILKK